MADSNISALINVYSVLSNALSVIRSAHDQALFNCEMDSEDANAKTRMKLLEKEEERLEARLLSLGAQIEAAKVVSMDDVVQKMRFEILAYGELPTSQGVLNTFVSD